MSLRSVTEYRHSHRAGQLALSSSKSRRVAIIGAGVGGLASAIDLARRGFDVDLFERFASPGGKVREVAIDQATLDAGPTVFTLPHVFDQLFADAGDHFRDRVPLIRANLLARHVWSASEQLDLFADAEKSAEAIAEFAGHREALGYRRFITHAHRIYETLAKTFMFAPRPSAFGLASRVGLGNLNALAGIRPFESLWNATGDFFKDPRLRQLFARYATYCGSSPFSCPATLMLIAHVEQTGVWYVQGGMHRLVAQMAQLAQRLGVRIHYRTGVAQIKTSHGRVCAVELRSGEQLAVDAVVCNADSNAVARGFFGPEVRRAVKRTARAQRSLSAITVNALARTEGLALAHHTVFFSQDYRTEFGRIFSERALPQDPTIYVCAQDRRDDRPRLPGQPERLLCLINAPPAGDSHCYVHQEMKTCIARIFDCLQRRGLKVQWDPVAIRTTTPEDFEMLFPGNGGALYGPASHGWRASFVRTSSRTKIPGLYMAGGSAHPGPGVPMAAISGRLAAAAIIQDRASI